MDTTGRLETHYGTDIVAGRTGRRDGANARDILMRLVQNANDPELRKRQGANLDLETCRCSKFAQDRRTCELGRGFVALTKQNSCTLYR